MRTCRTDDGSAQPREPLSADGHVAAGTEPDVLIPSLRPPGAVRRVLFYGKSMSRTRCTGALVDAWREHGVDVRWRNMATMKRWLGPVLSLKLARAEFRRYRPDVVFVFYRDLPAVLAEEFRQDARLVIWCEEALESLDGSIVDYFKLADMVCMSNPARFSWLRERGLDNMAFLMSGFSSRYHRPAPPCKKTCDVAFIGGPGRRGQRAAFLAEVARQFDTEVHGLHWQRWKDVHGDLRVRGTVDPRGYAQVCARAKIVLGINEVNDDFYYFSNRTFLTLACGGFHLTHYVPKLERVFGNGKHLAWYRDEEDALVQIRDWLGRDQERAEIAAEGHDLAMKHHRYYYRVARIINWLQTGMPRTIEEPEQVSAPSARPVRS